MKTRKTASASHHWFWSEIYKEWNLRHKHNTPSRATVFGSGAWIIWGRDWNCVAKSSAATVEEAKAEAFAAARHHA